MAWVVKHLVGRCVLVAFLTNTTGAKSEMDDLRGKIVQIQQIERYISASVKTGDKNEMKDQLNAINNIFEWLKNYPKRKEATDCGSSIVSLNMYGLSVSSGGTAASLIRSEDALREFRRAIPECEKRFNLSAPPPPNLR